MTSEQLIALMAAILATQSGYEPTQLDYAVATARIIALKTYEQCALNPANDEDDEATVKRRAQEMAKTLLGDQTPPWKEGD